jgi:hypothetical protein
VTLLGYNTPVRDPSVALIDKQEFVGLDGIAHLATGGEAPWLRSHDDACQRFGRLKKWLLAADGQGHAARLAERGMLVWGGDGRIRISAHLHDGADDVRRCLDELASIGPRR